MLRTAPSPTRITASGTVDSSRGFLHYVVLTAGDTAAASLSLADSGSTILTVKAAVGTTEHVLLPNTRYSSLSATLTGTGAEATLGISK